MYLEYYVRGYWSYIMQRTIYSSNAVHDGCNCSLIRIAYLKYRWPRSDKWYIHKYYIPRTSVRIYCSFIFFFFVVIKKYDITVIIGLPWNGNVQGRLSHSGIKPADRISYYIKRTLLCTVYTNQQKTGSCV